MPSGNEMAQMMNAASMMMKHNQNSLTNGVDDDETVDTLLMKLEKKHGKKVKLLDDNNENALTTIGRKEKP
jgi:hypothetical protein